MNFTLLFDPNSPGSIARAVNDMAADRALLQRFRENATVWSVTEGNWETESGKLLKLYCDLLGNKGRNTIREEADI